MKKTPKWLAKIALFCRLSQENGTDLMCQLTKELANGSVDVEFWQELLSITWFIIQKDKIVFQCDSQWRCLESKVTGEFYPANKLINDIFDGRLYIRQAGL